jgi:phage shock protein C
MKPNTQCWASQKSFSPTYQTSLKPDLLKMGITMAKQLVRSKDDYKIAGVCGGLGEFFDVDPIFFRAIFLISAFFGGLGILIYVVLWILMPEAKSPNKPPKVLP